VKKAKMELSTKHGSSQNDPSREIQQYNLYLPLIHWSGGERRLRL